MKEMRNDRREVNVKMVLGKIKEMAKVKKNEEDRKRGKGKDPKMKEKLRDE